jgi:hypothetical protein
VLAPSEYADTYTPLIILQSVRAAALILVNEKFVLVVGVTVGVIVGVVVTVGVGEEPSQIIGDTPPELVNVPLIGTNSMIEIELTLDPPTVVSTLIELPVIGPLSVLVLVELVKFLTFHL